MYDSFRNSSVNVKDLSKDLRSTGPSTAGHTPHAFYRALPYLLPLVSASLALKGLLATKSQKS